MSNQKDFSNIGIGRLRELAEVLEKAPQIYKNAKRLQEDIEAREFIGISGEGLVKVTMNGVYSPLEVEIAAGAFGQGVKELETLIVVALKDAYDQAKRGQISYIEELVGEVFDRPELDGKPPSL